MPTDKLASWTVAAAFASIVLAGASKPTRAEDAYPSRPVTIVVCWPAGGGVDTTTRLIAERLGKLLGQPFVIENRAGASGNIGAANVFNASPDGYTLLASSPPPYSVNAALFKDVNYDATRFTPIALMASSPNVLVERAGLRFSSAKSLVEYARANPGKLNYGSQGHGTTSHLTAEMLQQAAGIKMQHVPFRGTAPALNALLSDTVDTMFVELSAAIALHQGDKVKILAVASSERVKELPDIPTLAEEDIANFESSTWNAIAAPPKTPRAIVEKLNAAVNNALTSTEVAHRLGDLHQTPLGGTPERMTALVDSDRARWTQVIKSAGVTIE